MRMSSRVLVVLAPALLVAGALSLSGAAPEAADVQPAHFARCDNFGRRFLYSQHILWPTSVGSDVLVMLIEDVDVNMMYSADQWKQTFSEPPVFDGDHWSWNYGAHPAMGAFSYMSYRNRGGSWAESLLGAALNSVIYEYLIAGAIQQPSINDMLVTPLLGGLAGEAAYRLKKRLVRDRRLNGWEKIVLSVTDPFEVLYYGFDYRRMARAAYR